ncbi:unnamed protein product [Caenorhabditis auriculariae]|uniref:Uncharacterized protein n=1 Tax=Caenorhabditis auriculariae TaxID=2777116 RepID=A0A8S1HQM9_9PELO|nr:unnamed protein product [Caenorhabditis auriculariae]
MLRRLFCLAFLLLVKADDDSILRSAERKIPVHPTPPVSRRSFRDGDSLLLAQVVWRHGDRAPVGTYPTDEHQENAWPNGWGELTQLGMLQQLALGRLLFNRYINTTKPFLKGYSSKEVYIRSTDVNRTLVSAYANLAGMFENGSSGRDFPPSVRWPRGWTPVPVHTVPEATDNVGNVFAYCPRTNELVSQIHQSKQYLQFLESNEDFLGFLSEKTGFNVGMDGVYLVADVNFIETVYNMSQPEWLTDSVAEKLRNLSRVSSEYMFGIGKPYVPELIRLRGGPMLRSIVDKMNLKIDCLKKDNVGSECTWIRNLKYHAYSAHDTTIYALLTTFGDEGRVIRGGMPKYTASIDVELWDLVDVGPAVRVLFHSAFHHNYHVITHLVKGCPQSEEFCPFKTFEQRSAKFMPVNLEKECKSTAELNNRTADKILKSRRFS